MGPNCPKCGHFIGLKCLRCGHEWMPRDYQSEPKVCPKCKSPYWNKERQRKVKVMPMKGLGELMDRDNEIASQGKGGLR